MSIMLMWYASVIVLCDRRRSRLKIHKIAAEQTIAL